MSRIDDELNDIHSEVDAAIHQKTKKETTYQKETTTNYDREKVYQEHPRKLAKEIMNNPSPKKALSMRIGGRPIDLHALEKFVLFKTDQRTTPTILRYNNAYAALDKAAFSGGMGLFAGKKLNWGLIIILVILAGAGILFLLYGPELMSGMDGMIGGIT